MLNAAHRLALRIDTRRLALIVGVLIALLAVMGILRYGNKEQLGAFNLDGERNVPAVFSAALCVLCGECAAPLTRSPSPTSALRTSHFALLFAAEDDVIAV